MQLIGLDLGRSQKEETANSIDLRIHSLAFLISSVVMGAITPNIFFFPSDLKFQPTEETQTLFDQPASDLGIFLMFLLLDL